MRRGVLFPLLALCCPGFEGPEEYDESLAVSGGGCHSLRCVMRFPQDFVLRDRRMMLLNLRRCASVAVTEPPSPRSLSDAEEAHRWRRGPLSRRRITKPLRIGSSPRRDIASSPRIRHAATFIVNETRRRRHRQQTVGVLRKAARGESSSSDHTSRASFPVAGPAHGFSDQDFMGEDEGHRVTRK